MKLVGRNILDAFTRKHTDARKWIEIWVSEVEEARWRCFQDIRDRYRKADHIGDNRIIFDVKGNKYRMEVQVAYGIGVVRVKWAGTHAEYDKKYK